MVAGTPVAIAKSPEVATGAPERVQDAAAALLQAPDTYAGASDAETVGAAVVIGAEVEVLVGWELDGEELVLDAVCGIEEEGLVLDVEGAAGAS